MKLGTALIGALAILSTTAACWLCAAPAAAQDEEVAVEAPPPEVARAWALPDRDVADVAGTDSEESEAFARIHDADDELLALQEAERMVGFDLLDGVR